ncbi:MAG TPA: YqgE/AlgH family protein [Devosia sp.]|jgi:putative transcriptional regulator|nr:YqgE/AlgH family protein [Devosia sp.]
MISLKGQFLVAMPDMGDERFRGAVIYMVGHSDEGAMGLVINQPVEDMRFVDVLEELGLGEKDEMIRLPSTVREREVLRGGPVQRGRGFVLHTPDYFREGNSYEVSDEICLTATLDILKAMAFTREPAEAVFALGYCGWAAGQLENEIALNGWLTVPFSRDLLFGSALADRYDMALSQLGITRATLSGAAGHA